jgi:hypothetical protein
MYDYIDRPIESLDRGGRFLVWAMRSWVISLGQRQCPAAAIGPAFARWGIIGALPRFHIAMSLLNRHGLMTFGFAPLACRCVAEDEALLLATIRAVRNGSPRTVHGLAEALIEEESVAPFLDALTGLVAGLATSGLVPEAASARE